MRLHQFQATAAQVWLLYIAARPLPMQAAAVVVLSQETLEGQAGAAAAVTERVRLLALLALPILAAAAAAAHPQADQGVV